MSKTKEEIIKAMIKPLAPTYNLTIADCQQIVFPAMEEHAKNQAIEFVKWTLTHDCYYSATDENQWTRNYTRINITTEELYALFLQSQSQ